MERENYFVTMSKTYKMDINTYSKKKMVTSKIFDTKLIYEY